MGAIIDTSGSALPSADGLTPVGVPPVSTGVHASEYATKIRLSVASVADFEHFVRQHEERVIRYLLSKGVSLQDSQDLRQEAFLVLWKRRHEVTKPVSFLHGTIQTLLRAHWRAQQDDVAVPFHNLPVESAAPHRHETDEISSETRQATKRVRALLECLPRMQRQVIEMKWIGGLTDREIARVLAIGRNTVRRYANEGLTRMRGAGDSNCGYSTRKAVKRS